MASTSVVFPAPFGPMRNLQVALHEGQVDAVDGLETVEADRKVPYFEVLGRHSGVAAQCRCGFAGGGCVGHDDTSTGSGWETLTGGSAGVSRFLRWRIRANNPATPAGKNPTTTMNINPCA